MRRRWPALAATIPLVLVLAVATAHPAAAAPRGVRPGGPVSSLSTPRHNSVVTSSNWAGYVAAGPAGRFTSASASWTQTVGVTLAGAQRSSAEAIAEAPCCTYSGGVLPLTNFGTASFTSATANGQPLASFGPTEIVMPNTSVSAISSSGGFTVSYTGLPGFGWFGLGRPASD